MKKVVRIVAFLLSIVLGTNAAQAHSSLTDLPLNMVIGVPELIVIALFSCMAVTILIVVLKKAIHK